MHRLWTSGSARTADDKDGTGDSDERSVPDRSTKLGGLLQALLLGWTAIAISGGRASAQIMQHKAEIDTVCPLACLFGFSAGLCDDRAAIGAPGQHTAYAYARVGLAWHRTQVLSASALYFGSSIAVSPDWLAVGTAQKLGGGAFMAGSVHLFRWTGVEWAPSSVLFASDAAAGAEFGRGVILDGNTLVVGVPKHSTGPSGVKWSGAVYVFEWDGVAWNEKQVLHSPDPSESGFFGDSMATDGSTLLVGQMNLGPSAYKPGAVYVYGLAAGIWTLVQALHASDGGPGDAFSGTNSVAMSAGRALIASRDYQSPVTGLGKVYAFESTPQGWVESQQLWPADPSPWSTFGNGVALDSDDAVIGCRGDDGTGSAYHFRFIDGKWTQVGKLLAVDGEVGDDFSFFGVTLDRHQALVGAPAEDGSGGDDLDGAAYFFDLAASAIQYCSCPAAAPCANRDDHGGCRNSTGQGGVLAAAGSGSIGNDDLRFDSRWLPAHEVALTFMGSSSTKLPFGDGHLCVGAGALGVYRYFPQETGVRGSTSLGPELVGFTNANFPPAGQIHAGQTWYFQTWYRDLSGACGTGANLTNGVAVDFTS